METSRRRGYSIQGLVAKAKDTVHVATDLASVWGTLSLLIISTMA